MAYPDKFKYKVLYEERMQEDMKKKLDTLQSEYTKYERGDLTSDKLIQSFKKTLNVDVSDKLKNILKNPSFDNKNFRTIIKNLDILKDETTESRQATKDIKNHDYNKNKDLEFRKKIKDSKYLLLILVITQSKTGHIFPKEETSKNPETEILMDYCNKYIKAEIDKDSFKQVLKSKGVKVNNEYIVSAVNKVERGDKDAFKVLFTAITQHKNE